MGTIGCIMGKTYFALIACLPTVFLLFFLTDETIQSLNSAMSAFPGLLAWSEVLVASAFVISLALSFLLHHHHLRKYSYSLLASVNVPIQLLVVILSISLIMPIRQGINEMRNLSGYVLFGFLLSTVISCLSLSVDYFRKRTSYLTPIESVLSKRPKASDEKKPSFFRLGGFLWVDFEKGINIQRDEVGEILARLSSNGKSVLVVGNQASGKSMVLRNVGYELAINRFRVFFVNADSLRVNLAIKEIKNWDMSNVVILLDDVHRNPIVCSDFLEKMNAYNVKVVLSSRPLNMGIFAEGEGANLKKLFDEGLELQVTEAFISKIISNYCKSHGFEFKPKETDVKKVIQICGTDLWLINYLLSSWDYGKTKLADMAKADVYEKVYEARVSKWVIISQDAPRAIQTVCALYQFEVPCKESYLIDIGLNDAAVRLSLAGHLIKKGKYYYLHHPSVARIYLETLQFHDLIKDSTSLSVKVLSSYLEKSEEERGRILYKMSTFPESEETHKLISKNMLKTIKFEDIKQQIQQEEDIDKISSFFLYISNVDADSAKTLLSRAEESLTKKIQEEPRVQSQKNLISVVSRVDTATAEHLSKRRLIIASVTPLFNEERTAAFILRNLRDYVDLALAIDDGSTDNTQRVAEREGAVVVKNHYSKGLFPSILTGLEEAARRKSDAVILDVFPWIRANAIPRLIKPILKDKADLVLGRPYYTQALSKKGVEKFQKYIPKDYRKLESQRPVPHALPHERIEWLRETSFLFSKILRVEEVRVEYSIPKELIQITEHERYRLLSQVGEYTLRTATELAHYTEYPSGRES